jgi:hypothetical protein
VLLCDEWFVFVAFEFAVEFELWCTGPKFSTATFGEAFTEVEFASAFWLTEFDAFCDWLIDCDPPLPQHPWPLVWL